MKKTSIIIVALVMLVISNLNAQTNNTKSNVFGFDTKLTNALPVDNSNSMPTELTFGGSGFTSPDDGNSFGLGVGLSVQPFKYPIWLNINQNISWDPQFSGETSVGSDWSWEIVKDKLYINTGWNVAGDYDKHAVGWHTGPEASIEYYTSGNAFYHFDVNYNLLTKDSANTGWHFGSGRSAWEFDLGIGITPPGW